MTIENSLADDVRQVRHEQRRPTDRIQWPKMMVVPTTEQLAALLRGAEEAFEGEWRAGNALTKYHAEFIAGYVLQRLGG